MWLHSNNTVWTISLAFYKKALAIRLLLTLIHKNNIHYKYINNTKTKITNGYKEEIKIKKMKERISPSSSKVVILISFYYFLILSGWRIVFFWKKESSPFAMIQWLLAMSAWVCWAVWPWVSSVWLTSLVCQMNGNSLKFTELLWELN